MGTKKEKKVGEKLENLESRVEKLEKENEELKNENEHLKSVISSLEEDTINLSEKLEEYADITNELEGTIQLIESRLDATVRRVDDLEEQISNLREVSERKRSEIAYRLSQIEDSLDLDIIELSVDDKKAEPLVEKFSSLPDEVKKNELSNSKYRAILIYENFTEWGEHTKKGYVLKSSRIKNLLSASENIDLEYPQIYRAMEELDSLTPPEFEYKEQTNSEKLLIKYHDTTEARANSASTTKKN